MAIDKPKRVAWNRSFFPRLQKEPTLSFGLQASRNVRRHFCCFSHPVCGADRVALKNEYSNRRRKRMIEASSLGGERVYEYHWITLHNRLIWHDEWKQKNLKQVPNVYLKYVKEDLETPRSEV